jgi:hypothetical protein
VRLRRADERGPSLHFVERVYVADAVHDKFVDKVVEGVRHLKVGGDDSHLGAMTSPARSRSVKDHLEGCDRQGREGAHRGPDAISGSYIQADGADQRRPPHEGDERGDVRPGDPDPPRTPRAPSLRTDGGALANRPRSSARS